MTGNSAIWGTMTVEARESQQITRPTVGSAVLDMDRSVYQWRPSEQIRGDLPEDYCVSLEAMSYKGVRRLYPDNLPDFLLNASLGGLAIRSRTENLTGEQRYTYNLMRLLVQYGPSVQEALDRTFSRRVDLLVLGHERFGVDFSNILPDDLGLNALGRGKQWSVADLLKAGRDSAKARDLTEPSTADLIQLGLVDAAKRNPFDVTRLKTEDAARILRLALFDLGPAEVPISDETRQEVEGRLLDAFALTWTIP